MPVWNDSDYLLTRQYRTADHLVARQELHRRFGREARPWYAFVLDHLPAGDDLDVLEVGTGPAALWRAGAPRVPRGWRLTLTDLSPGMIEAAERSLEGTGLAPRLLVADVQDLPFDDDAFDAVVANHMLYHLPDLDRGLAEIRRVLRPGGTLLAATNGEGHMRELTGLMAAAWPDEPELHARPGLPFRLETGEALLAPHFAAVERVTRRSALEVTEAEPLLAYVASTPAAHDLAERDAERFEAGLRRLAEEAERQIDAEGAVRIARDSGLFLAR